MNKSQNIRWGVVSTIKAPARDILEFAAYHLDLGAARVTICLDDDNPQAEAALNAHPKCQAVLTPRAYWMDTCGFVPKKHQVRQSQNASRVFAESTDLDWLAHIDVDEFICPNTTVDNALARLDPTVPLAHLAPVESLCIEEGLGLDPALTYCKARPSTVSNASDVEADLYPNFGGYFKDGFVSHTAGKNLLRVGRPNVNFNIHRAFEVDKDGNKTEIKGQTLDDVALCHRHIESWDKWLAIMEFRMSKGSYREELDKKINPLTGRVGRHTLFSHLQKDGTKELRSFFDEVCLATPELRNRLSKHGLLRTYALDLSRKIEKHFPDFAL